MKGGYHSPDDGIVCQSSKPGITNHCADKNIIRYQLEEFVFRIKANSPHVSALASSQICISDSGEYSP